MACAAWFFPEHWAHDREAEPVVKDELKIASLMAAFDALFRSTVARNTPGDFDVSITMADDDTGNSCA